MDIAKSGSDRLDRCTFLLCSPEGKRLGTGVLLAPLQILTCAHVVKELRRIAIHEKVGTEPLTSGTVVRCGHREGPDDLALLRLDKPLHGRGGLQFVARQRGEAIATTGFPRDGKREHADGTVQGASDHGWLKIDVTSGHKIEPGFSGAAAWSTQRKALVGIVTRYAKDGAAYLVPKEVIDTFLAPEIPPAPETVTGDLPNLGGNRWVRVVDGDDPSVVLGSGFRLDVRWVATAWEVARASEHLVVCDPYGNGFEPREATVVWPTETAERWHIALLQTPPVPDVERFEIPEPFGFQGARWGKTVAHPIGVEQSSQRQGILGTLQAAEPGVWKLEELVAGPAGFDDVRVLLGSAVFVSSSSVIAGDHGPSWSLLGILNGRPDDAAWRFEVHSLADLCAWTKFREAHQQASQKSKTPRSVLRVKNLLQSSVSRAAVAARDPEGHWQALEEHGDHKALAESLCFHTAPHELSQRLLNAYCDLADSKNAAEAGRAFDILMEALPTALREHRTVRLPETSATEIRLGLAGRIFVDFALAAAENGAAVFHPSLPSDASDVPAAVHQMRPSPGELGWDPEEEDVANEVIEDVKLHATLHAAPENLGQIIARWAARRPLSGGPRWLDPAVLADMGPHRQPGALLAEINAVLATPTASGGRRFYFLVSPEESEGQQLNPLVASLRQVLPELKIVTLEGSEPKNPEYGQLRRNLVTLFNRRRQLTGLKT